MEPLKVPVAEVPGVTGESMSVVYDAINCGHLETFLVGRRRFARPEAIRKWIDYLEAESKAGRPVSYRARKRPEAPQTVGGASGWLGPAMRFADVVVGGAEPAPGYAATASIRAGVKR